MASPPRTLDLEAGPEMTPSSTGARTRVPSPDVQDSPLPANPAETTASGSSHPTVRSPDSQIDTASDKNAFTGAFGQALLFVVNTGRQSETAITVPVYRPSVHCAKRMVRLEKGCGDSKDGDDMLRQLISPPPERKGWVDFPRWREFRWVHPGETEVDIWDRIKRELDSRRPRWHAYLPFWRVAVVEERDVSVCEVQRTKFTQLINIDQVLLYTREGSTWTVSIEPAVDVQEQRRGLANKLDEIGKVLDKYNPDDYICQGSFDAFGEWYTEWHDNNCCRKGVPIDPDYDEVYRRHGCDRELEQKHRSKLEKLERLSDFIERFKDPSNATTMFPLTTGRVLNSCIHDNG